MEANDENRLGFDQSGNYVGLKADDERTHYDVMHAKYRQCSTCKRWFPEEGWPVSKLNGKPTKPCAECLEKTRKAEEARKERKESKKLKKEPPEMSITSNGVEYSANHYDLSDVPNSDIIREIRRRGWKGNVTVSMDFEL